MEEKTAETTMQTEVDSHADVDVEEVNEAEFEDKPTDKEEPSKQTKEQNSENARRRREAERQEELKRVKNEAIITTLKGKNPYTGDDMKDSEDVAEYLAMREIEDKGGDPVNDYSKFQKEKARAETKKQKEESDKAEWYKKDKEDFIANHPDVNLDNLIGDKHFQNYAYGKVGNMPLSEIYNGYIDFTSEFDKKAKTKTAQILANAKATPGARSSPNTPETGYFTKEQVQKMTPQEVHKNYDNIRASMQKWEK